MGVFAMVIQLPRYGGASFFLHVAHARRGTPDRDQHRAVAGGADAVLRMNGTPPPPALAA
jgi:hypothetical protein